MQTFDCLAIGDTIYVPRVFHKELPAQQCPDCLGTGVWHVSTPAGLSRDITCPRCHGDSSGNWIWPRRFELTLEINQATVSEVSITVKTDAGAPRVSYSTSPYIGHIYDGKAYASQEEAQSAGEVMLAAEIATKEDDYARERQRQMQRAGQDIVTVLASSSREKVTELENMIERLKEKMMDAIRHPSLYGPKVKSGYLPEVTSQAMADWLSEMLSEADIEGWTESELHEAMCQC